MSTAQFFHKVETSQMSAFCFKLFRLSCSVLTFKSLKAEMHLLSWNHLLFICVIGTFWVQTKTTAESLLERPGTHSPLFRCQSCYSEMCSIRLLMVLQKVHSPDKNWGTVMDISWSSFCLLIFSSTLAGSWLCWVFCSESHGYSKGYHFHLFLSCFYVCFFFFSLSILLFSVNNKRSSSINNCGELGCTPFVRMFKLF